jgi:hypothetical protein
MPQQGSSSNTGMVFVKGMIKDINDSYLPAAIWAHARNATKVSANGDLQTLGNEPANLHCVTLPYTCIGTIHLHDDLWAIFTTDDFNSEIGTFDDSECKYISLVKDPCPTLPSTPCLNFNRKHLIIGISKQNSDCTYQVYWADSVNPDRTMTIEAPAFKENCVTVNDCITCTPTCQIDCEALRLASLMKSPCLGIARGSNAGNLQNGSYFAVIAYTLNGQRMTDYFPYTEIQSIFEHENLSGSLQINIKEIDSIHFDEFELVIVRTINQQTTAKRIGLYSTRTSEIFLDQIPESLIDIPLEFIPIRTPVFEKSKAFYEVNNYALRVGPSGKFDFNYQPLANRIKVKWLSVAYPPDYYRKGGNKTSYLRDELYALFIRWVYNTGDRSSSYHIPGRDSLPGEKNLVANQDALELLFSPGSYTPEYWEVYNTSTFAPPPTPLNIPLADGGTIIGEGPMGYWESTEKYPDDKPDIWNASTHPWSNIFPAVDLCGQPIRHHKMPENLSWPGFTDHYDKASDKIRIIALDFSDIRIPVDNNGIPIPGIVGYEILRGSREGNKSVIAKGIINNMRGSRQEAPVVGPNQGPYHIYQNYPYNPLTPDPTLTGPFPTPLEEPGGDFPPIPPTSTADKYFDYLFTFHSPDTQFRHPFLSAKEIKVYGEFLGDVRGRFEEVTDHPKEKLLKDKAFSIAALIGIGAAVLAVRGKRNTKNPQPIRTNAGFTGLFLGPTSGVQAAPGNPGTGTPDAISAVFLAINNAGLILPESVRNSIANALTASVGSDAAQNTIDGLLSTTTWSAIPGWSVQKPEETQEGNALNSTPPLIRTFSGVVTFSHYFTLGTNDALRLIEALVPYRQYAYRYRSHGLYDNLVLGNTAPGEKRRLITDAIYLDNQLQNFGPNFIINNLYRGQAVALQTSTGKADPFNVDDTIQSIGTAVTNGFLSDFKTDSVKKDFDTNSVVYYAALKVKLRAQYGQMGGVQELPTGCPFEVPVGTLPITDLNTFTPNSGEPVFGGDTYVTRYSEKNSFFYFHDWLLGQPEGTQYDYRLRYMLQFPKYWANFDQFEVGDFLNNLLTGMLTLNLNAMLNSGPSGNYSLDSDNTFTSFLAGLSPTSVGVKRAYFYLFQSGVRDFFVESEINTDLRDWGDLDSERHYDPYRYTSTLQLFDPKIIKAGNFFKYDISLSISRLFINFVSWGNMQPNDYDPLSAQSCFTFYPHRVIYSLPQNMEATKDYWRVFLANNYKDFKSTVSVIKPINKSGAVILFDSDSPLMFQGVDTLQTELGTKITIGDGGLFSQPQQSVVNVDESLEYGSCQNRLSVLNTPFGLYYMCTNQGKIFQLTQGLHDITFYGLKFWMKEYLPYKLLEDFPTYPFTDNPVIGIGCQSIYDNQIETIYFCKRDFKLKVEFKGRVVYQQFDLQGNEVDEFILDNITPYKLGDPFLFDDASWTVSYDPKTREGGWISFHDWHPNLVIPSKNNFLSIQDNQIWRHNKRTDRFCNYYGVDYPFELEYIASTQTTVNTLRSLEYYLECYKYNIDTIDRYQFLDQNFDYAVIYNTEQVSGELRLNLTPKNDPYAALQYPIINSTNIDILFTKEEQKYRFNQFWDITDDRGEFTTAERMIWFTEPNGYKRSLNPLNLNYNKLALQRKKFRHYLNHVILNKKVSGNVKMLMKVAINKNLYSPR